MMKALFSGLSRGDNRRLVSRLLQQPCKRGFVKEIVSESAPSTSGRHSEEILPRIARQALNVLGREKYQRFQQLQSEFRRQKKSLASSLQLAEEKLTRAGRPWVNSIFCSASGQRVMAVGIPLSVSVLWPRAVLCEASSWKPSDSQQMKPRPTNSASLRLIAIIDEIFQEIQTLLRGCYLSLLFSPCLLLAPLCVGLGVGWLRWVRLLRWCLERAGPAFIKWGQWAATRPDLFPPDVCDSLTLLHSGAPSHSYAYTKQTIEQTFKRPMDDIFSDFEQTPVASGSIAQVHRGVLNDGGAFGSKYKAGTVVAVKVRHPKVTVMMQRDFILMRRAAFLCSRLPWLQDLRLEESVQQFGGPLKEQLDLSTEADSLARFNYNFKYWPNIKFPAPVYPLVAPNVLVETFQPGRLISRHVNSPNNKHNEEIADLGLKTFLKMLLVDNFIHADLHPGNILVRVLDPNSLWGRVTTYFGIHTSPKLILLDVGMVARLLPEDQQNMIDLFRSITEKDGRGLAHHILRFSDDQRCKDPDGFVDDMAKMFDELNSTDISDHTSEIMAAMMDTIRKYQVDLKGIVSTVVVTTLVLEGWSTKLDPNIKILDALRDLLPRPFSEHLARSAEDAYGTAAFSA